MPAPAASLHVKGQQATFHDWESGHYDAKWSISFDDRCIDYARGRFLRAVPQGGRFDRVLEIGSGTGFFLLNLAQAGFVGRAFCTDISPGMVEACTANGTRLGIPVSGRVADAEDLPFPHASFDLVLGHAVLHHLPDVDAALAECLRVLRPGGRLVIAGEPSRWGDAIAGRIKLATRIGVKLAAVVGGADRVLAPPDQSRTQADHLAAALEAHVDLHTFDPAELEARARRAGFADVRVDTEELTASWFGWATRTVEGLVRPGLLPYRYPWVAYWIWRRLYGMDELARRVLPRELFYNCILTGVRPER